MRLVMTGFSLLRQHAYINIAIVTEALHLPDETQKLIREKLHQSTQHTLYNVGRHCIYLLLEMGRGQGRDVNC